MVDTSLGPKESIGATLERAEDVLWDLQQALDGETGRGLDVEDVRDLGLELVDAYHLWTVRTQVTKQLAAREGTDGSGREPTPQEKGVQRRP